MLLITFWQLDLGNAHDGYVEVEGDRQRQGGYRNLEKRLEVPRSRSQLIRMEFGYIHEMGISAIAVDKGGT